MNPTWSAAALLRLLIEIRRRMNAGPPLVAAPVEAIMRWAADHPNSPQGRVLVKVAGALLMSGGFVSLLDLSSLDQETLGLIVSLIERLLL